MHHPMTRRTVGEIEVLEAWGSSKKLVPVGRHFIQSCHTICPVNGKRRKLWHTLFRACHNFFDPPLLEGRIEWIACRIVHWQQQEYSSIASAKVKTVLRENRHRHILEQKICGMRDRNLPLRRCNRKSDACHASNDRSPCSGGIDNTADAVHLLRSSNVVNAGRCSSLVHRETRTLSSKLAAKSARGFRCTSGSGLFARIDDEDIRFTSDGKVIRNACANDTTTNDEMIDGSHSLSDPGSSTGGNYFVKIVGMLEAFEL